MTKNWLVTIVNFEANALANQIGPLRPMLLAMIKGFLKVYYVMNDKQVETCTQINTS